MALYQFLGTGLESCPWTLEALRPLLLLFTTTAQNGGRLEFSRDPPASGTEVEGARPLRDRGQRVTQP